jgi:ketosteroid isomerase-like protein
MTTEAEKRIRDRLPARGAEPAWLTLMASDVRTLLTDRDEREAKLRAEVDALRAERDALAKALTFYATQEHFILSDDTMWDTVSGEPPNWWCDEAGTATVEDGSIARLVLAGGQSAADVIAQIEKERSNG